MRKSSKDEPSISKIQKVTAIFVSQVVAKSQMHKIQRGITRIQNPRADRVNDCFHYFILIYALGSNFPIPPLPIVSSVSSFPPPPNSLMSYFLGLNFKFVDLSAHYQPHPPRNQKDLSLLIFVNMSHKKTKKCPKKVYNIPRITGMSPQFTDTLLQMMSTFWGNIPRYLGQLTQIKSVLEIRVKNIQSK